MPHKGHSDQHCSNHSNPTRQGYFQSFDWYLPKVFLIRLYFDHLASARSEFCKMGFCKTLYNFELCKTDVLKMRVSCEDVVLIFWGDPLGVPVNSEYSQELCETMNDLGLCENLPHFLSSEIWPQNVEFSFHQVRCSCQKIFLNCCCVRRTDFALRYTSIIFIRYCVV